MRVDQEEVLAKPLLRKVHQESSQAGLVRTAIERFNSSR